MNTNYFLYFSVATIFLLILNAYFYFKGFIENNKAFKIFTIYLFLTCVIQLITLYVGKFLHKPNLFLSHFYLVVQFIFLSIFYKELLKNKWITYLIIPFLGFLTYQYIEDPSLFFRYNAIGISITQGVLIIYSIIYLYRCLQGQNLFLIINVGLFLYLISSTLIFASGNLIFNLDISESMNYLLINTNRILYFLFQILIFIEWRKNYYKKIHRL